MARFDFWTMLGYTNNAYMFMDAFGGASNVILTDNPPYTLDNFKTIFPMFPIGDAEGDIPLPVFNLFLAMANKAIKKKRYGTSWEYIMGLYIAHYLTLYLQTQNGVPGAQGVLQSSLPSGVAQSKSVDGLSISYDLLGMSEEFAGYGTYKNTIYGQQLITLTRYYGGAGMWVNG